MKKMVLAAVAVVALVVIAGGAWRALGGDDEKTERGTCGNVTWELGAEDEDGGVEVTFELQSAAPGETWQVVIEQDGTEIYSGSRQTDEDAELDVDVTVSDKDGSSFSATATPESGEACTASLDR
ncbi:hypothetical protein KM427_12110 [Nocardioides sp. LMS-CY]|uniref:hypothetical protein n=1 Tax=Nocardioides sp. (strain LMS-CY) TaxID=2840457 RepID=UPI001C008AD5|nr:hypothetical protein [Nocardioides sp. LMS-CY]QWF24369.1 hypothetical protein KM427_12110 [Nocardioides sp. LMS-CY]